MGGCGVATGKATHNPLLSEWVMQQPLPWKAKCFRLMFESAIWALFGAWEDDEDDGWLHLLSAISDKCDLLNRICVNVT